MGGAIVGMYAAKYGDESLASAILVCPAGVHSPELTEFLLKSSQDLKKNVEGNILLPSNPKDFDDMIKLVMYHKINIPSHIAMAFVSIKKLKADVHRKGKILPVHVLINISFYNKLIPFLAIVLSDMNIDGEYLMLDKVLEEIQTPVLCVWGEHDKVCEDGTILFISFQLY